MRTPRHRVTGKLKYINLNAVGGPNSGQLVFGFGDTVLSRCAPENTYTLVVCVPNYMQACGEAGRKLFARICSLLVNAYCDQTDVMIEYECPPPSAMSTQPYLTYLVTSEAPAGVVIPMPDGTDKCPL